MVQTKSSAHAKSYFSDALMKSDYFISDQELPGFWQGRLAERLGISGATSKDAFFLLCENSDPKTGKPLTPLTREGRTVGYDINFHCPKSVSLLHSFAKDDHVLKAFQESVTETMQAIEADAKTRVRVDEKQEDRSTEELVWAHFTHQTARPVAGHMPDPHLHSHCFVFNATFDSEEGKIKAAQFRDIKRDMPFYQAQFHKRLADKLMDLGYGIRATDKSFEVEGVPQAAIDLFSKRTDAIGRVAQEKGITDAKELGELGARTRARKQKGHSMDELKRAWLDQIHALGGDAVSNAVVRHDAPQRGKEATNEQCINHAVLHCFERASVMDGRRIQEIALRYSLGKSGATASGIAEGFAKDERIIHVMEDGRALCTTKEVLKEEKHMVDLARKGQGAVKPLYEELPELTLFGQQREAVAHVLTTSNRVSIIRGAAGTGKTTLMKEAVGKIEAAGKKVVVVAPTAQASRGVLKEEGFSEAETVARLLVDPKMQEQLKDQVLWVDEAGLLGTKDMSQLLEIATKHNARLILGGDTRQHASVIRGDALRIVNKIAGIKSAEVSKIYRQDDAKYREAVEDLSKGEVEKGFNKLEELNFIHEVDPMKPNEQIVDDYVEAMKKGKSTLIISPTHAQGDEVTREVRDRLKIEGMLDDKEIKALQYINLSMTEAEKADDRNFKTGHIVKFTQNVSGFKRGSVFEVEKQGDKVFLKDSEGLKPLPADKSAHYNVFATRDIGLANKDRVLITSNGFDSNKKRLDNGMILEVAAISETGQITLRNGISGSTFEIDRSFGHIAHAHCITSHASQGKTVDEVFVYQPAGTFGATDAKQFYVSVSRARQRAHIYTDDKEELLQHASELGERLSAMELVEKSENLHKDALLHQQHEEMTQEELVTETTITQNKDHEPDKEL